MFVSGKRPGRGNKESADVLLGGEFSVHFGKPEIVTDAETNAQIAERKACERIARSEAGLFFDWRDRIQMSLAIFRDDVALRINQNLGIVDR